MKLQNIFFALTTSIFTFNAYSVDRIGCLDFKGTYDLYTDISPEEQIKIPGGKECRCLPGATNHNQAYGHGNVYAQVVQDQFTKKYSCKFQHAPYNEDEAHVRALRYCAIGHNQDIPLRFIKQVRDCIDTYLKGE